jgi:AcrR family transcriptional regulator
MRVTEERKTATRRQILDAAIELFRSRGFEATTTRDIATAAEIASGTVFNYFSTKEAIVAAAAGEALAKARSAFARLPSEADLAEELFALVAAELRQLKPLRKFIAPVLETSLSPLIAGGNPSCDSLRTDHLELVAGIARRHGQPELSTVALQMYWTLYTGVLAFWAGDKSPKQEDTLALLDQSLGMFIGWLQAGRNESA